MSEPWTRPSRRKYQAVLLSLAAFWGVATLVLLLLLGVAEPPDGPLIDYVGVVWVLLVQVLSKPLARYVFLLLLATPAWLVALGVFAWVRGKAVQDDGQLRCLACGYILKGLSEPRCPECGERI